MHGTNCICAKLQPDADLMKPSQHHPSPLQKKNPAVKVKYCSGKSYHHAKFDDHTLHGTNTNIVNI